MTVQPDARVVVLCGPRLPHRNTCATLIDSALNVVGVCIADQRTLGLPVNFVRKSAKRTGVGKVASQTLARLAYRAGDRGRDREMLHAIFDEPWIQQTLDGWSGQWHETSDYSSPETIAWIESMAPDALVVHTPYWVGKKVRALPTSGVALGGHPGITPYYRGSHSAFWAILKGRPEDVGCTVFVLDDGADTGDVVAQERIEPHTGDSFVTLAWRGMKRIAELQRDALLKWISTGELERRPVEAPPDSYFQNPTLSEYLHYRKMARAQGLR